tara:strand:- start:156 stop:437 length:282 start_codon:yes stop_codon:yes gene_type:complete
MHTITYTWGYSDNLHNDGFSMEECDTCNMSIRDRDQQVYMHVSVDEKWGDRMVEYDEGFFCSTRCLRDSLIYHEVHGPDDESKWSFGNPVRYV